MGFVSVSNSKVPGGTAVVSEQALVHLEKKGWKRTDAKADVAASPAEVPAPKTKES